MSRSAAAVGAALLVLGGGHAARAAGDVDALLGRLDRAAASVERLAGDFTQTSRIKIFRQELVSKGRLMFQRPRKIRWEYLEPDPSRMIIDGERATLVAPNAAPRTFDLTRDATMRAITDQLFLWLGSGSLASAQADYEMATGGSEAAPELLLTPKANAAAAKAFARIELRFDKELLLRRILLRERSGDEKEILFPRMLRNPKLPADAFTP